MQRTLETEALERNEKRRIIKETNILLGELTRSKFNNNVEDKNLHQSCSSISDDDDGDDDLNDLVMSEPTNSKSSIVGQFVGCVIVQCGSFFSFNQTYWLGCSAKYVKKEVKFQKSIKNILTNMDFLTNHEQPKCLVRLCFT